ncbi:ankyrin repeat and SOCS box protein 9 isoform X2 [Pipistrellus kuhlii]|uniref:Ankyrin repeat and SOCS box containing 9 n=1 Tax=Pipistrellus kuhlii TaxID=59472 RepID=A0A7J7V5G5_PIPKU|nr:ankyrin repeat and SOCS box protein 9 isoform X2 [Pipistrellus kuhlii]KAF6320435.1 ankyrin repeat and SOCS box containing 9 [Pipistrellus kuhlii]
MDREPPSRTGSKPSAVGVFPATTRFLSNPLMGGAESDWSPVHEAAVNGRLLTLRNLIGQGWGVNITTADCVSPLHEACLGGHASCVSILLKHGAQVDGVTTDWHTPLFNACVSGSQDCVKLLLEYGASPHPVCDLASPIHEAAKRGHVECIESIVAHGGDIDYHISRLGTPLYLACQNMQIACVRKLLQSGANVNRGRDLEAPLHAVARASSGELANLLMDFGADIQAKNAEGKRPLDLLSPDDPLFHLFLQRKEPPSLMQLCRLRVRKCFGIQQHHKINGLLLPDELKNFLLHL